jgi:hypothetical protein
MPSVGLGANCNRDYQLSRIVKILSVVFFIFNGQVLR